METVNLMPGLDRLLEVFKLILFEILLIMAAIGASDNRLELETDETERNTTYLALPEGTASGESLETVTVEQR